MNSRSGEAAMVLGIVREWHEEDGWGVIDAPTAPGGCWVHVGFIESAGRRFLIAGDKVWFAAESGQQDGYGWRAIRVIRDGETSPGTNHVSNSNSNTSAYSSRLTITFKDGTQHTRDGNDETPVEEWLAEIRPGRST